MTRHMQREIERLNERAIALGRVVEDRVHHAIQAVIDKDEQKAMNVISGDREVDALEVELEEECLKLLALYQPVATDLRLIIAVLKMNSDLERIGDLAVNIAERALGVIKADGNIPVEALQEISQKVKLMLRKSLLALVEQDPESAQDVLNSDHEIDNLHREMFRLCIAEMKKHPERVEELLATLSCSRNLERIADHASNIAEDVVYMVEGEIVRHSFVPPEGTR